MTSTVLILISVATIVSAELRVEIYPPDSGNDVRDEARSLPVVSKGIDLGPVNGIEKPGLEEQEIKGGGYNDCDYLRSHFRQRWTKLGWKYDRRWDREWEDYWEDREMDRCMRGCLRNEGIRFESLCMQACDYDVDDELENERPPGGWGGRPGPDRRPGFGSGSWNKRPGFNRRPIFRLW